VAGFTDSVLRGLVRMFQLKMSFGESEMISAEGLHWGQEKDLLKF
jgi:tRNA-dihydrouridine synthase